MEQLATAYEPYTDRRRRVQQLSERYPHAQQVLRLYGELLEVQQHAYQEARANPPEPSDLIAHITEKVLPGVMDVTIAVGPAKLAETVVARFHSSELHDLVGRWIGSKEQSTADRYLARAASAPVLEAGSEALVALCAGPRDERHCPRCGGLPQVGYFALSGEVLVTGPRYLLCSRCSHSWVFKRMVCAGCGETASSRQVVFSEEEQMPHLRIDGCESCKRYLLSVDLRKDAAAVPLVDELAAVPLDLYAKDRGMTKVVPNLMGF